MQRVSDDQREDENEAAELDEALGGGGMRLDDAHDGARGAPALEIGERHGSRGNDRLDRANLVAIDHARLAEGEHEPGAVVGDRERGHLPRAQRLCGLGVRDAGVAASDGRCIAPDEKHGDDRHDENAGRPVLDRAASEGDR